MENEMNTATSQNPTEKNLPNGINGNTIDSEPLDLDGMTDFELVDVFLQRCGIIKIEGELHYFNGKHFVLLDDNQINRLIWSAFQKEKKQIRSSKKIKAIADALRLYEFPDYQESDQWLAFENGSMYGRDTAFLDRIVCIPFTNSIPKIQWDKQLLAKLEDERERIMMKALFYYQFLSGRNGKFSGDYPPDVEFRLSENETIKEFVTEYCELSESFSSYTEDLYSAYLAFCSENNLRPVRSKSGFAQRLSGLYSTKVKATRWREDERNIRGFEGIILKKNDEN